MLDRIDRCNIRHGIRCGACSLGGPASASSLGKHGRAGGRRHTDAKGEHKADEGRSGEDERRDDDTDDFTAGEARGHGLRRVLRSFRGCGGGGGVGELVGGKGRDGGLRGEKELWIGGLGFVGV